MKGLAHGRLITPAACCPAILHISYSDMMLAFLLSDQCSSSVALLAAYIVPLWGSSPGEWNAELHLIP